MFETIKEVDEEKDTKEKNIFLTRESTASLLSGNIEYSDEINNSLTIEGDVTKNNKSIAQLKYDSVFLLNYLESTFYDKLMEKYM